MQFKRIAIDPRTTRTVKRVEHSANRALRWLDRTLAKAHLGGRRAPYDDELYEFLGGSGETLRKKHYDKSLRLLWKAEAQAPYLDFRDCTAQEKELTQMAERAMSGEEKAQLKRLGTAEYRALLNREYTPRQKQAIVNLLSAVGHGEAYAWLTSAELMASVKTTGARAALTMQVLEEAKHFLVLRELARAFEVPVPRLSAPEYLMLERVLKAEGLEKFFGMNVLVEGIALGLFGALSHLPGLEVLRMFHLDESRHTALPTNYFREFPLSAKQKQNVLAKFRRLFMIAPALLLIPTLEDDMAELGIDAFDFGGSVVRKITQLSARNGFELPFSNDSLLEGVDQLLNTYCRLTRPGHVERIFTRQETTRGVHELSVEREVFLGQTA